MMESPKVEEKILTVLEKADKRERRKGVSLEELSKETGLCRTTVSKHVGILEAKKQAIVENYGNMKLVYLNKSPEETKGQG
jgi:predicted transcriptional regulator